MTRLYAAMETALWVLDNSTGSESEGQRAHGPSEGEWTVTERLTDRELRCLAVSPDVPDRVFCGTFDDGLLRSSDGGREWTRVGDEKIESDRITVVAISPHDPSTIWAGTEPSAVYRSVDAGDSWERREGLLDLPSSTEWFYPPRPDTHHVRWIEPDSRDPERLYVGIELGALVVTDDAGETWSERPPGSRRDNHSITTHPAFPGWVWSAAGDGFAESHDSGNSWAHPQEGLDHRYCWSVAVAAGSDGSSDSDDASEPGNSTVLVSSASGARSAHSLPAESYVYRREVDRSKGSEQENSRWQPAMDGLPEPDGLIRAQLASGSNTDVFALTNRGLFRSVDAGRSWSVLSLDTEWPSGFEKRAPHGLLVV